ncbi:UNVERIFIED_CONTAM: hypothetical protein Cloal_2544 [Acetivibrio alkalicellulosi]
MKKNIVKILVLLMIISVFQIYALAERPEIKTAEQSRKLANEFLQRELGLPPDYFSRTNKDRNSLNNDLAVNGTPAFENMPVFVYGNPILASGEAVRNAIHKTIQKTDANGNSQYRCLGYTIDGDLFANPAFPPDYSPDQIDRREWVYQPWDSKNVYIKSWIDSLLFRPDNMITMTGKRNYFAENIINGPRWRDLFMEKNVEDYVYILQPPTMYSWGLGISFYYWNNGRNLNYNTMLLVPFDMLKNDISAKVETKPSATAKGREVLVGINVKSTFEEDVTTDYAWEIRKKSNGAKIPVEFLGHARQEKGDITIPRANERVLYARFTMPDSDVTINFLLNETGTNPEENYLGNNSIETEIKLIDTVTETREIALPYNVLSRDVSFLLSTTPSVAQLASPRGSWSGAAWGRLNIDREPRDGLFRNYSVSNNLPVNETGTRISRNPRINTTFDRRDFGDDPQNKKWSSWSDPNVPISKQGILSSYGSINRNDVFNCGVINCPDCPHTETRTAYFNQITSLINVSTHIYNGRQTIPAKSYKNEIENNRVDSLNKKFFWRSDPYRFNVIRWMYHLDQYGNQYGSTPVDGRYQRTFTQQCTGDIEIEINSPMENEYLQGREAARNGINRKELYDKAVFATDRELQRFDYPIKSGYYFNPAGTYSFTVETVTYKPTRDDTREHADVVNALVNSFRYESDLMYLNSHREGVNIVDELLPRRGSSFDKRSGILTAQNNKGVDGSELLTVLDRSSQPSRYTKRVEEIHHTQVSGGDTHEFWRMVMEGYSESGTLSSRDNYMYREYVREGHSMYRITERTQVDIVLNQNNHNMFTHVHMPDGEYYIRVWMDNIDMQQVNSAYRSLGTLSGVVLDEITVTVKGSMYDD